MRRLLLLAMILGLAMSGTAFAATYGTATLTYSSSSPNITLGDTGGSGANSGTYNGDYGVNVSTIDANAVANGFSDILGFNEVYCVDLSDSAGDGTYTILDLQDMAQISSLEAIDLRRMVDVLGGIGVSGTYTKEEEQAAAWEIVYGDGTLNLSAAPLTVTGIGGGTVANAQALLTAVASHTTQTAVYGLYNASTQDWGIISGGPGFIVPEPATVANLLGLLLVGGFMGYRRLRR